MKRFLLILSVLMLAFALASCAQPQKEPVEFTEPTPALTEASQETEEPITEIHALVDPRYYETFEELVSESDAILIGTAGAASCKRVREDRVMTHTEFLVREAIKGSVPADNCVTIVQNGGEADGLRFIVEEAGASVPYLQTGTEYLLFLSVSKSVPEPGFYAPMNSFVIYEVVDETVSPISTNSVFITRSTQIGEIRERIEKSLAMTPQTDASGLKTIHTKVDSAYIESFADLVAASDAILIGTAGEAISTRTDETEVRTDTEVRIREVIKGDLSPNEPITVMRYGGEADGLRVVPEEAGRTIPYLQTGTEYLLFLKQPSDAPHTTFYVPITSFEGFFEIADGSVSPVSFASDFITKPTPLEDITERVKNASAQEPE